MKLQELYDILRSTTPEWMNVGVRQHSEDGMSRENFPIHTFEVGPHLQEPNGNRDIPCINVLVDIDRVQTSVGCLANSIERYLKEYGQDEVFVSLFKAQNPAEGMALSDIKKARVCPDKMKFSIEY